MSGIDVLAVMDSAAWLSESEINRKELEEARAAVAELIDAAQVVDSCCIRHNGRDAELFRRLESALSRVRGAE